MIKTNTLEIIDKVRAVDIRKTRKDTRRAKASRGGATENLGAAENLDTSREIVSKISIKCATECTLD